LAELEQARAQLRGEVAQGGIPVLVTGYVPEPLATLETLNRAGAFVAADDYAAVGRRVVRGDGAGGPGGDPWVSLVDRYWAAPPCPTRSADQGRRLRYLVDLQERSGARGVLLHVVKFCEPELFDAPAIRKTFAARGVPVLYLEGELEAELSGQIVTRIEAFAEMLRSPGRAA
jgi:benzoyl-CoA reductase/2-hydroxyglutaryl-CoA dehydratase subunit BcrC/BadD/HgdB